MWMQQGQWNPHPGIIGTEQHHHHHQPHVPSTTMGSPGPSNSRESRNMAEKQRRNNLAALIAKMASLVPTIGCSSRKMDRITILKKTAHHIRQRHTLGPGSPGYLTERFGHLDAEEHIIDSYIGNDAFLIVLTRIGKIVFVSRRVKDHFGYSQDELIGSSLYNYIHEDDHEKLTRNLTPDEMQSTVHSTGLRIREITNDNSNSSDDSTPPGNNRIPVREQRRTFTIRMAERTDSRRGPPQYDLIEISGVITLAHACRNQRNNSTTAQQNREMMPTSNDVIFVGVAELPKKRPITELSIMDANKDEYITRHLVDGRIIYCDHRVSAVAGYMTAEVCGRCAFTFMHKEDSGWTMIGLRQMYDRAEKYGTSCYRLLSKTGEFIYLRTRGYLEYDKESQTVVSLVCINTLVPEEEGLKLIQEMKERFSATVTKTTQAMIKNGDDRSFDVVVDTQRSNSKNSLTDRLMLEDAIKELISDLPSNNPETRLPNVPYVKLGESKLTPDKQTTRSKAQEQHNRSKNSPTPGQVNMHMINSPSIDTCLRLPQDPGTSVQTNSPCDIKTEQDADSFKHMEKSGSTVSYLENNILENGTVSCDSNHQQYELKRTNSDEDLVSVPTKKTRSEIVYMQGNFLNDDEFLGLATDFNQYNSINSSQSVSTIESPSSSLHESGSDYQQLKQVPPLALSIEDDETTFAITKDSELKGDNLLYDSDVRMEIFNNIRSAIEIDQPPSDGEVQQLVVTNQDVSDKMYRAHAEVERTFKKQGTQLDLLGQIFENSSLPKYKEELTQCQAEYKRQKQIFKTLQQDHQNLQVNVKYNIGV